MPSDRSYGSILRTERERGGYDLTSMSRRLHIRPDILQAIENCDFDRMPARGYSKNMVRAYARALKLDEQAITDMFLDEMHMHEVGAPRRSSAARGSRGAQGGAQPGSRRQPSRQRGRMEDSYDGRDGRMRERPRSRMQTRAGRDLVDPNPTGRHRPVRADEDDRRASAGRMRGSQGRRQEGGLGGKVAMGLGAVVGSFAQGRGRQEAKVPRSFSTIGSTPPYARGNAGPAGAGGFASMNLPMILAVVAAVVVLLIVVVVISNGSKQASEDVPNIPISGLTDTSSPDDAPEMTQVDTAPEFAEFKYFIGSGDEAWLEIYEDGSEEATLAEVVEGPAEESFEVRTSLTIKTGNPSAVKLELDGEQVEFEKPSGSNVYSYTVDFDKILEQWNIDHGRAPASSSSSSSSSSKAKSSGSKSSSDSSSGSSSSSSSSSRGSQSR